MNPRNFTRTSAMLIVLTMFLLILASAPFTITLTSAEVTELNVPPWVVQGETLSISGKASANEAVWISSSFELSLPVSGGEYCREFNGIHFPAGEKVFSVTAENIKNIRISLSPVLPPFLQTIEYPLEGPLNATDSTATISISFPVEIDGWEVDISGKKNVSVYGDAADGATSVNLKIGMSIKVTADPNGDFALDINTEGVPLGEFLITAGGIEKTVEVVSTEPTPTMPDLVITEKWVCWPDNCTICYNVTNIGNGTVPAGHNTTLYVDGDETAHDQVPVDLAHNESYIGCFDGYSWIYTPPEDNITVCADNNETVDESDEGNNCLTNIWKCGDVDEDGSITTWDVGLLNARRWDPSFVINEWAGDVNGDGYITTWDVGLLNARRWDPSFSLSCKC